jgi:hypothetical protein
MSDGRELSRRWEKRRREKKQGERERNEGVDGRDYEVQGRP